MSSSLESVRVQQPVAAPASSGRSTLLKGNSLLLARVAWVTLIGLYLALFVLGVRQAFERALVLSPETIQDMTSRGLASEFPAWYWIALDSLTLLFFGGIAVFIMARRSNDWIVMLVSLTLLGTATLYTGPSSEAGVPLWLIAIAFALAEVFQVAFVFLFPDGRFVRRWQGLVLVPLFVWRPLIWGSVYLPNYRAAIRTGENYGTLRQDPLDTALMVGLFLIGIFSQVYRYRNISNQTQRQQTKWLVLGVVGAITVAAAYVIAINALGLLERGGWDTLLLRLIGRTTRQLALALLPVALAFSILRYGLWEIDVIIRRTLVYVPLSGILAGLFAATITLSQKLFVALTGQQSDLATVLTTLVVVAAFTPIRDRLQASVDKRFKNVSDAAVKLESFAEQIRSRVTPIEAHQVIRRFLEEAVAASGAKGGTVYLENGGALQPIQTLGAWDGHAALSVPLTLNGMSIGKLDLGARKDGDNYPAHDRAALEQAALVVARAIEQDRQV